MSSYKSFEIWMWFFPRTFERSKFQNRCQDLKPGDASEEKPHCMKEKIIIDWLLSKQKNCAYFKDTVLISHNTEK